MLGSTAIAIAILTLLARTVVLLIALAILAVSLSRD